MQSTDESNISGLGSEVVNIPSGWEVGWGGTITAAEWLRAISLLNVVFAIVFFPIIFARQRLGWEE